MREQSIQAHIMDELCKHTDGVVFRCNAGEAWGGKYVVTDEYGPVIMNPRKIKLLPEGFSDLLYVGNDGKVAFIECKTLNGKAREAQERFISLMRRLGHRAGIARSPEEALRIVGGTDEED